MTDKVGFLTFAEFRRRFQNLNIIEFWFNNWRLLPCVSLNKLKNALTCGLIH